MCRDGDVLLKPSWVLTITNKKEQNITLSDIADNKNGNGFEQSNKNDFIDIKLGEGRYITEINVVDDNVELFYLEITDIGNHFKKYLVIFIR